MVEATDFPQLKLGMVGGGDGAFIGAVHRYAARLDGHFELVAGALSSTSEKSALSGQRLSLPKDRIYPNFAAMAYEEAKRDDPIDAVAIVTPNHKHFEAAEAFLKKGIHVICEKPLTSSLADAKKLVGIARSSNALLILTHNYTGYPMVRQAREMISKGELGKIRVVQVEYPQEWLAQNVDNKQASWRTDPAQSGNGGSLGDIGTHAFNIAEFVTGLKITSVAADLQSFVSGRRLDDNAHVMLRLEGDARGVLWSSQVAPGHENSLKLRIYGEHASLEWAQEEPNFLWFSPLGEDRRKMTRASAHLTEAANRMTRIPAGHPEGYLEGFANIYAEAAMAIRCKKNGTKQPSDVIFPTVEDGLRGLQFIEACLKSSQRSSAWTSIG